jgi:hypothetical protein
MGKIYWNADRVVIWLGKEDKETEFAMAAIPDLLKAVGDEDREGDVVGNVIEKLGILYVCSGCWTAFMDLFKHPYFHRM